MLLIAGGCSWWILLNTGTDARRADREVSRQRAVEQPSHVSCPLGDRTANAPPGRISVDRRVDRSRLRIATFNVEWLFDGVDDNKQFVHWQNDANADSHLQKVASAVGALDADILNLVRG